MNRHNTILLGLLLIGALSVAGILRDRPAHAQRKAPEPKPPAVGVKALLGVSSCAASVCHGGGDLGKPFSEATTWRTLDPHARAYDALLKPESQAMARRLWGDKAQAHEAPLCLKCHVHSEYDRARPNFRKEDGVGCESCHGAAQDWLAPHYRAAWKNADQHALGLADTKGLTGRAQVCVKCHVGTADANVDHDLIAAGHPALRFEFATYLANLPPHWDVAKDKRANSTNADKLIDFEARAWKIGQFVTAQCALELLAHRADPVIGGSWPELAEFDCFSCHHDLHHGKGRQNKQHLGVRRPGSLVGNPWYLAVVKGDAPIFADCRPGERNRAVLAQNARNAAAAAALLTKIGPVENSLLSLQSEAGRNENFESWDQATQHYLSMLALRQFQKDNKQPVATDLERRILKLRDEVTFAPGFNSPHRSERKK